MAIAADLPGRTRRSSDLVKHSSEVFAEAEGRSWMLALSPADREVCALDLVDAARASSSTEQPHLVRAELTAWKETATALAAGLGRADL